MAVTSVSNVSFNIQDVVSAIVTEELIQNSVLLPSVVDRSAEVGIGMDRLSIPRFDKLTLQAVSETAEVTPQTITGAQSELILNQHFSYPFSIGDKVMTQSKADLVAEAVRNGARVHAAGVDNFMISLMAAAGDAQTATASAINDITLARQLLTSSFNPLSERYLLVGPEYETLLLRENSFINAEKYGSVQPVQVGEIGRIFGFTVIVSASPEIPAGGFLAYHRMGSHFARQIAPKFESERRVLGHRNDYSLSQIYGGVCVDDAASRILVFSPV